MRFILPAIIFVTSAGCATTNGPTHGYNGTVMFACGVTDGPSSKMILNGAGLSPTSISIFVHDLVPEQWGGEIEISDQYYIENTARVTICDSSANCAPAIAGSISIASNSSRLLAGTLRYQVAQQDWHELTFRANIVDPPKNTICG